MRYWLPIESMDFWFGCMEVGKGTGDSLHRGEETNYSCSVLKPMQFYVVQAFFFSLFIILGISEDVWNPICKANKYYGTCHLSYHLQEKWAAKIHRKSDRNANKIHLNLHFHLHLIIRIINSCNNDYCGIVFLSSLTVSVIADLCHSQIVNTVTVINQESVSHFFLSVTPRISDRLTSSQARSNASPALWPVRQQGRGNNGGHKLQVWHDGDLWSVHTNFSLTLQSGKTASRA